MKTEPEKTYVVFYGEKSYAIKLSPREKVKVRKVKKDVNR